MRIFIVATMLCACEAKVSTPPPANGQQTQTTPSKPKAKPKNRAPEVALAANQTVHAGVDVVIDGSSSRDPDGDALTYQWKQSAGPNVTLSETSAATTTFVAPSFAVNSTLELELTVTDSAGASASGTTTVVVLATAPDDYALQYVFVVAMENQDASDVYTSKNTPFIQSLMKTYGYASAYGDDLPSAPSEPHYIWMEAGTNAFTDHTFTNDDDPSADNSTAVVDHLSKQIDTAGLTWLSYQEDMPAPCPVVSAHPYAAKHDPFVFFRDVSFSNDQPDENNAYCASHHRDFSQLKGDLAAKRVARYNFITPNQCNDMHGALSCSNACKVPLPGYGPCLKAGDDWLAKNLPPMIDFALANRGVVFLVWDEPEVTSYAPFILIGPHVIAGKHELGYSHGSLTKSVGEILRLPLLPTAGSASDFTAFFEPGYFP